MFTHNTLLKDQALDATVSSAPILAQQFRSLSIQWSNDAGTSPSGAITVLESDDPQVDKEVRQGLSDWTASAAKWVDVTGDSVRVSSVGDGLTVSAANDTLVNIVDPARWVRVLYTRTSGTATAQLWYAGRDA